MSMHREIDKFVKQKMEEVPVEYDQDHWKAMEGLLADKSRHRSMGWEFTALVIFILLSIGIFFGSPFFSDTGGSKGQLALAEKNTASNNIDIVQLDEKHIQELRNEKVFGNLIRANSADDEVGLLSNPRSESKLKALSSQDHYLELNDNEKSIDMPGYISNRTTAITPVFHENEETTNNSGFSLLSYQKPWNDIWQVGVGWHVENSWGWSTGAFASLGYRFHKALSVSFRPGFTLRSDNDLPTESYKQIEYDFGRNDIEGEVSKMESYAVDVPLSLQLHNQRHLLSVGGGIHYAFMQRVSITENQLSDLSNLTNSRDPFHENTIHRKTWVQPNESLYPFAELYYSYLLTPSFELGGRSRFYIPDDLGMSNRLNFAAQLVWRIN